MSLRHRFPRYGGRSRAFNESGPSLRRRPLQRILSARTYIPIVSSSVPEAVFSVCKTGGDALSLLFSGIKSSDAVLIGCGKGNTEQTALEIGLCIEECAAPLVIDADGINALSEHINLLEKHSGEILLTPHPAEMARLINSDVKTVQQNRQKTASDFAKKYGVTVILKGHGTVIALKDGRVFINPTGNPGMATGGSGDVLSGYARFLFGSRAFAGNRRKGRRLHPRRRGRLGGREKIPAQYAAFRHFKRASPTVSRIREGRRINEKEKFFQNAGNGFFCCCFLRL